MYQGLAECCGGEQIELVGPEVLGGSPSEERVHVRRVHLIMRRGDYGEGGRVMM